MRRANGCMAATSTTTRMSTTGRKQPMQTEAGTVMLSERLQEAWKKDGMLQQEFALLVHKKRMEGPLSPEAADELGEMLKSRLQNRARNSKAGAALRRGRERELGAEGRRALE